MPALPSSIALPHTKTARDLNVVANDRWCVLPTSPSGSVAPMAASMLRHWVAALGVVGFQIRDARQS